MQGHQCWLITLTKPHDLDFGLRQSWHVLRTRLRQKWPDCQAWTVVEWKQRRGVHLHAVVKGTPDISAAWVEHVVRLLRDGTEVHIEPVYDPEGLAHYVTKSLADKQVMSGWPKHFRPVTTTRGWWPEWLSRKEWSARHRTWGLK